MARPPVVVSGLPNMTPIFMRSWLMKMAHVRDRLMLPVSLRRAWDMRRACSPMWESPISPSSSAWGTRAATESRTMTSRAPERTRVSTISRACSPESGWEMIRFSTSTPMRRAKPTSRACSASTKAAVPPARWASRMTWRETIVLPAPSGP